MSNGNDMRSPSTVAWIALVIGVLAFIFAWMAYNRAGTDLGDEIQQETQEVIEPEENETDVLDDADVNNETQKPENEAET